MCLRLQRFQCPRGSDASTEGRLQSMRTGAYFQQLISDVKVGDYVERVGGLVCDERPTYPARVGACESMQAYVIICSYMGTPASRDSNTLLKPQ